MTNSAVLPYLQSSPYVMRSEEIQDALAPKTSPTQIKVAHDYPIQLWTAWDVPSVQSALDQHALGSFYASGQLADAMGMDDAFDAVMQTRVLGLLSREINWTPSKNKKADPKKAKLALTTLRERWDDIAPDVTLGAILRSGLQMGFQVSQVIWDTDQDVWMPSLQTWHPTLSFFRNDTRTYVANAVEGQLHVIPGNGQWSLYTPYGYYRGWLQGAVRAISLPWLCRQYALRDWARYSEAHGLPIKKVYVPSQAEAIDKDNFFTAIASLSNESAVMIPRAVGNDTDGGNYDLQLLEATANTWEGFQGLITKCETRMAIRMLGQNLTTEVDAGSLAAASVHERIRLDYVKADAKSMASALVESIIKPFCRFNYGDDLCAPEFEWNTDPIEDKVEKATVVANIASAMYSFAQAGVPVDQRALLKLVGVPVLEEGVPAPGPIAPQPAPPTVVPNDIIPPGGAGPKGTPPGPKPPGFVPPPPMPSKDAARTKTELLGEKLEATHPGRTFSQELADAGQDAGRAAMRAHVSDVLEAVNAATTVDELRGALSAIAKSQEPGALGRLVENSLILGELSGRYSVTQEK